MKESKTLLGVPKSDLQMTVQSFHKELKHIKLSAYNELPDCMEGQIKVHISAPN